MISNLFYGRLRYSFLPLSKIFGTDSDNVPLSQIEGEVDTSIREETGWDRVKKMYSINEFGEITPEFNSIIQVGMASLLVGAVYGGYKYSKVAYEDFMVNNNATTFKNHFDAKKQMQDHITINFVKGALRWSSRIAFLSMSLMALTTTIQVYRNKYGISEYVAAGVITGAAYKFNMGPKGMIAGGIVGSGLGCLCGVLTTGLLKLAGVTMQESHMWRHRIRESRMEMKKKIFDQHFDNKDYAIIQMRDREIGEKGHTIEAVSPTEKDSEVKPQNNVNNK